MAVFIYRGIVVFFIKYLFIFREGIEFYKNYFKIGLSGLTGGLGLGIAMTTFIWSITNTSAAVTLLCLAGMPFISFVGFYFKYFYECLDFNSYRCYWNNCIALGNALDGSIIGLVFGLLSAIGFAIFSVN